MRDIIQPMQTLDPLVIELLKNRGITEEEEIIQFLEPSYNEHLHDPFLLKGMDVAVERILKAIKNNERIGIWSDYDADGIPGAVILHDTFKKLGYENFVNYIPHRHDEGFGLNNEGIEELSKDNIKLIITIDCGITDVEQVEFSNSLGIDVIITDHHLPHEHVPKAFAIINPKQIGCNYPEKMLCGAALAWKLAIALLKKSEVETKTGWEKWLLDMVGIATLSDMVPLRGENRALAWFGLLVLRKTPRVGLRSLFKKAGAQVDYLTEDDIGFTLTPRINVASRMSDPIHAFNLLKTTSPVEAEELVGFLEKKNNERKGLVASITKEIKKRINEEPEILNHPVLVFGGIHWKPAVLGLAANTMMRETGKPVFVWGKEDGTHIKGSCRSPVGISVVDIMSKLPKGILLEFGGHACSGGFGVEYDRIHDFQNELNKAFLDLNCEANDTSQNNGYDTVLTLDSVNRKTSGLINKLAPFGESNSKPLFLFNKVKVKLKKLFGKTKEHVELQLEDETGSAKAIQFFAHNDAEILKIENGSVVSLIANLEESRFGGRVEYRLRIVKII